MEPLLPPRIPPWTSGGDVSFQLDVGPLRLGATAEEKKAAAELHLGSLPQCATWLWTDGSVEGGVKDGGAGAVIIWPDGEEEELKTPAGRHCSSYRAEMLALASGLEQIRLHPRDEERNPIIICTDSMSSLATLRAGPAAQTSPLGVAVWRELEELSRRGSRIVAQWIPSHCGVEGNERADAVARDAAALPQRDVPADSRTICRAVARSAREKTIRNWPPGWYRSLMDGHLPQPVTGLDRSRAIDVHQLRAGHWSGARSYLHRIGRHPTVECRGCSRPGCPVATVPHMSGGARPPGPPAAEMSGADVDPDATNSHHTSRTGGGTRKRCGGGPGGRRQIRPEPRGYATLTRGPPSTLARGGRNSNNNNNNLQCDVITALKFPSSHDKGKKFGEELQVRCCVNRAKLSIRLFSQIYYFVKSTSKRQKKLPKMLKLWAE